MLMAKKGLGKGLNGLFEGTAAELLESEKSGGITKLKINSVEPNKDQPRKVFDAEKLETLAESIKEHGLIQPITVTAGKNGNYLIIAGERRWRAAKKAGLSEIPAIIGEFTPQEAAELALIENLQREDLNPIEEALGYRQLLEKFSLTQEDISKKIGKSRSAVANSLRLLSLDDRTRDLVADGMISSGHARALLSVEDPEIREALVKRITEGSLNVRQAEALAKQLSKKRPKKAPKEPTAGDIEIEHISEKMSSALGTKVKISHTARKGRIEIEYYGNDDLERLLTLLNVT